MGKWEAIVVPLYIVWTKVPYLVSRLNKMMKWNRMETWNGIVDWRISGFICAIEFVAKVDGCILSTLTTW